MNNIDWDDIEVCTVCDNQFDIAELQEINGDLICECCIKKREAWKTGLWHGPFFGLIFITIHNQVGDSMSKDRKTLCFSREIVEQVEALMELELRSFSTMGEVLIREALANRRILANKVDRRKQQQKAA